MITFLIVLGVHFVEIAIIAFYILIRKVRALEKTVVDQQTYLSMVSSAINDADQKLKEIDARGSFEADDEIGWFFKAVKLLQEDLNRFNLK